MLMADGGGGCGGRVWGAVIASPGGRAMWPSSCFSLQRLLNHMSC